MSKIGRITVDSLDTFKVVAETFGAELFVFRGHGATGWKLESTIERLAERYGVKREYLLDREGHLFTQFIERAHHHEQNVPDVKNTLEWAALIQHYSGPTRLLDVTESYWIAAFFAVEKPEKDTASEIWAFRKEPFGEIERGSMEDDFSTNHIRRPRIKLARPQRLNKRIVAQQGLFMVPTSLDTSSQDLIMRTTDTNLSMVKEFKSVDELPKIFNTINVWRIVIPADLQSEIARFLKRTNITAATLFPGIDGVGRSLNLTMRLFE